MERVGGLADHRLKACATMERVGGLADANRPVVNK
jgi:hypothetical protein